MMKKLKSFCSTFHLESILYPNREKLIREIESKYNQNPTYKPDSWEENVHTSIQYGSHKNNLEYFQKSGIPLDLVCLIDENIQSLIRAENLSNIGQFYISEMWYNVYKNGQYQHKHKHSNAENNFFSGVFYLQFDEKEHSSTRFFNPYFDVNFEKLENNRYFSFSPKVKEHDLIIFPCNIGHDVPYQHSSKLRITISFNVSCIFHDAKQYS